MRALAVALVLTVSASAQFVLQQSNTTASLRGISTVSGNIAWASGTSGTVLRTIDGGMHWQTCATPPDAGKLDFRGIQAFSATAAIVVSSGNGDLSRVYRTTDGCATWSLVFSNPDAPDGFFDGIVFRTPSEGWLLGDPVRGRFYLAATHDGGLSWKQIQSPGLVASGQGGAFAASNQSLILQEGGLLFGGGSGLLYRGTPERCPDTIQYNDPESCSLHLQFQRSVVPVGAISPSAGIFAFAQAKGATIAVGGDYTHPADNSAAAAVSTNNGATWQPSQTQPLGYRSTLAYDQPSATWITTGPTGTDISIDNGRTWQPLLPAKGDATDADRNWNALALPFVVGPKGRIGKLRDGALHKR